LGAEGQFSHPLVARAKLEISAAAHAHGKTPSHCVVTEFNDAQAMQTAASRAAYEFGFTRMWSIHPSQVRPILAAFSPSAFEVEQAADILQAAVQADWAPIQQAGQLHDRASYRFFWSVLERAHATGQALPAHSLVYFQ
jgi:citrate lyase subunit beta/citryl-CoA lyase